MTAEVAAVARLAESVLPLRSAVLHEDYYYQSLTLCVINAIFSINARYKAVQNVVDRYCRHYQLQRLRNDREVLPDIATQEPMSELCRKYEELGVERFEAEIYANRQRTSPRGGITKAEAVFRAARVFKERGIEYLQHIPDAMKSAELSRQLRAIPGQASGISLRYLWMLGGSDSHIKPDRMILRFLQRSLGYTPSSAEAHSLLSEAVDLLKPVRPDLTPRLLDFMVWQYESTQDG